MNIHRKTASHSKCLFGIFTLCTLCLLTACGKGNTTSTQARSDLTVDHIRGLYSGMMRQDIEDLLGTSDSSLGAKETIEVYGLADGSTAVLRYHDDTLRSAYIRDKENKETPLFGYDTPDNSDNTSAPNAMNESEGLIESVLPDETMTTDETTLTEMLP